MGNLCLFENKQVSETFAKPEPLSLSCEQKCCVIGIMLSLLNRNILRTCKIFLNHQVITGDLSACRCIALRDRDVFSALSAEGSSLSQPALPESNLHPLEINRKISLEFLWPPLTPVVPYVTDSDISYVCDLMFVS